MKDKNQRELTLSWKMENISHLLKSRSQNRYKPNSYEPMTFPTISRTQLQTIFLFCLFLQAKAQIEINAGEGLIYLLIVVILTFNFCAPPLRWIYVTFFQEALEKAAEKARELSQRLSDRISDAGRKVSDRVLAV
jgi:hypothetical protein